MGDGLASIEFTRDDISLEILKILPENFQWFLPRFFRLFAEYDFFSEKHWFSRILQIQGIPENIRVNYRNVLIIVFSYS